MKKAVSLLLTTILLLVFAACGPGGGSSISTAADDLASVAEQAEGNSTDAEPQEELADSSQAAPNGASTLTVEISPAVDSVVPLDDPYVTFSLAMPDEWVWEDNGHHQYVYFDADGALASIIEGSYAVTDPENPFADVWEQYEYTLSLEEVNISAHPVLRHVIANEFAEPPSYSYNYYVQVDTGLIYLEFNAPGDTPDYGERFDAIVASLTVI